MRKRLLLAGVGPLAVGFILATVPARASTLGPEPHQIEIPSMDLSEALQQIALRTGRNIIAPDELVRGHRAPAVSGNYSAEQAVRAVLQGTGLVFKHIDGALVIAKADLAAGGSSPAQPRDVSVAERETVVVTGTRIRGAGSTSPVTVVTRHALEEVGVNDLADFTRILPQNYAGGQNRGIAGGGEQGGQSNLSNSATLNLRGLGPDATLTLLNGHRLSYDATDQGIDISAIPLSAIERIEVVTDGASALYGSDAVGGVANIILRRDYEGLETTVRVGRSTDGGDFQKEYSGVGGHRWASGGFMLALDGSSETPIFAGQRSYTQSVDPSLTLTDRNRQLSGVLTLHQKIAPWLSLELDANAMDRRSLLQNPFSPTADVLVSGLVSKPRVTSYAFSPTLRAHLGRWQATLDATGSDSRTFIDANLYTNGVPRHSHLLYMDTLKGVEGTGEGPLFALPGGDVRLALGGGLRSVSLHERYQILKSGQTLTTNDFKESRNVQFAYGELSLPLVAPGLGLTLINRLTLSGALRYEHWNGIASVTTPKVGLIYQPTSDFTVRATWGKSFKIPTLDEIHQPQTGALYPGFYFTPPPQSPGSTVLAVSGSAPNLKPERATTWSATLEWKPRLIPGLDLRSTYFHVDYRNRITNPITSGLTALYNPLYDGLITYNPSAAQVNALISALPGGLYNLTGAPFDPSGVGAIIDSSARNTERQRIRGVDLNADYRLSFGPNSHLLLTGAASYLNSKEQLTSGQALIPLAGTIFNPPHWRGRAGAIWDVGRASLSALVNYVGPTTDSTFATLETVGAFVTLDFNASLRTDARSGVLRNVELRVSALNVLNEKPHHVRNQFPEAAPYDSTNESPVGRFIGASLRKVW